jgi:hypothetical protein
MEQLRVVAPGDVLKTRSPAFWGGGELQRERFVVLHAGPAGALVSARDRPDRPIIMLPSEQLAAYDVIGSEPIPATLVRVYNHGSDGSNWADFYANASLFAGAGYRVVSYDWPWLPRPSAARVAGELLLGLVLAVGRLSTGSSPSRGPLTVTFGVTDDDRPGNALAAMRPTNLVEVVTNRLAGPSTGAVPASPSGPYWVQPTAHHWVVRSVASTTLIMWAVLVVFILALGSSPGGPSFGSGGVTIGFVVLSWVPIFIIVGVRRGLRRAGEWLTALGLTVAFLLLILGITAFIVIGFS